MQGTRLTKAVSDLAVQAEPSARMGHRSRPGTGVPVEAGERGVGLTFEDAQPGRVAMSSASSAYPIALLSGVRR